MEIVTFHKLMMANLTRVTFVILFLFLKNVNIIYFSTVFSNQLRNLPLRSKGTMRELYIF